MATIVTRAGKGSPLTNAEVDANFVNLNTDKLEADTTATLTNKTINIANNTLTGVQPTLVSGTNIKTVNSASLLGSGDIPLQAPLVSGTNIKTVNGTSVLGSGNIQIDGGVTSFNTRTGDITLGSGDVTSALGFTPGTGDVTLAGTQTLTNKTINIANNTLTGVQPTLVSGTNIKTINSQSLVGSGNLAVTTGAAGSDTEVQFNSFGSFAASSAFRFNTGNNSLSLLGPITAGLVTMSGGSGSRTFSVALGMVVLSSNTTGERNTGVGYESLRRNTTGSQNTAVGTDALRENTTGFRNCAFGEVALRENTTGNDNIAFGQAALVNTTTGSNNTGLGYNALSTNTTGNNNTGLGNGAQASSATVSNTITLGNSSIDTLRCQVTTITSLSDARDKTNIVDIPAGLSFVQALRPVAFDWNMRDGGKIGVREFGFVAQELQAAQTQTGTTVPNLVYDDNPEKLEASAGTLIPVLVKAIQELKAEFDAYKLAHP